MRRGECTGCAFLFLRLPSPVTSARPELSHELRAAEVSWLLGRGSVAVTRAERQRAAPKASDPEDALAPRFVYAAAWRCAKWPFYISSSLGHASCRTTGGGQMAAVVRLPCRPGGSCAEMSAPRSDRPSNLSVQRDALNIPLVYVADLYATTRVA